VSRNPVDFGAISVGKVAGPLSATLQNSVDADVVISPAQACRKKPRTMWGFRFPLTRQRKTDGIRCLLRVPAFTIEA